jgi:hypothetical protein
MEHRFCRAIEVEPDLVGLFAALVDRAAEGADAFPLHRAARVGRLDREALLVVSVWMKQFEKLVEQRPIRHLDSWELDSPLEQIAFFAHSRIVDRRSVGPT